MNNKTRVRITESDLHRIVRESVNKVLTELDWKTKMNAAKKAEERWLNSYNDGTPELERSKMLKRADMFANSAYDSFIDEFGYEDDKYKYGAGGRLNPRDTYSFTDDKTDKDLGSIGAKHFVREPYRDSRNVDRLLKRDKNAYDAIKKVTMNLTHISREDINLIQ